MCFFCTGITRKRVKKMSMSYSTLLGCCIAMALTSAGQENKRDVGVRPVKEQPFTMDITGSWAHNVKFKSWNVWSTTTTGPTMLSTNRTWLCDGEIVWKTEAVFGGAPVITKWDLKKLSLNERRDAIIVLFAKALDGIMFVRDPELEPELWPHRLRLGFQNDKLIRVGEERIGEEDMIRYKLEYRQHAPVHIDAWFAKKDGLLRKQVIMKNQREILVGPLAARSEHIDRDLPLTEFSLELRDETEKLRTELDRQSKENKK